MSPTNRRDLIKGAVLLPIAAQVRTQPARQAGGTRPVVIASANGIRAVEKAYSVLAAGGDPLDAVRQIRENEATRELPVIGFLSHVDRDLAQRAESAGVTRVMPRSQFSETLPDLVMDLLAPGTKREIQEEPELPDE